MIGSSEYDWRGNLDSSGFLDGLDQLPDPIYAKCRSESQVAETIAAAYSRILRDPKVTVRIVDRSNRAIARLDGAVRTPHRFRIEREARLIELLVAAGGISDAASGEIRIQRPSGLSCSEQTEDQATQGPNVTIIKIDQMLKGGADSNPVVLGGDIVTVLEAYPVYIIGGVKRPGSVDSRSQLTLSRSIAIAGGLEDNADRREIVLHRRNGTKTERMVFDLEEIDKGRSEDPKLVPFDIVSVSIRGRSSRRLPPDPDSIGSRLRNSSADLPLKVLD